MRRIARCPATFLIILIIAAALGAGSSANGASPVSGSAAIAPADPAPLPARPFPHPDRIRYDSQCFTIDGKDVVIFSGAFHYFRCPRELWKDRFATIKRAGFNTVETYIAWNRQEPEMPASLEDFSKARFDDVEEWLNDAEQAGLYVIIRPGPYICAEFDRGGYPGWLALKKPEHPATTPWFRGDDPVFVAWSKHWLDAVCPMLAKHQITHKAPGERGIILFQLENEYDGGSKSVDVKTNYIKALAAEATAQGIDVPLFTCWTRLVRDNPDPALRGIFDSCNFYPGWKVDHVLKEIQSLANNQPDAPLMTTELQGGWFTKVDEEPPLRPGSYNWRSDLGPAQITNLTLFAWQNGETATNYYMLFGGTNLADTAAAGIATSYDYSAPIRENGGVDDKYLRVQALAQFVKDHGSQLARSRPLKIDARTSQPDVTVAARQAPDGSRFFFVRTGQHLEPRVGQADVTITPGQTLDFGPGRTKVAADAGELAFKYDLEPFGSKVLYFPPGVSDPQAAEWLPRPVALIARPAASDLPTAVEIKEARVKTDPGPADYKPLPPDQSLNALGIYDSRFVYYHATRHIGADQAGAIATAGLAVAHAVGDRIVALVNGVRVTSDDLSESRTVFSAKDLHGSLRAGYNDITLLYENEGAPNGGLGMEKLAGVTSVALMPNPPHNETGSAAVAAQALSAESPSAALSWSDKDAGVAGQWWKTDLDDTGWTRQTLAAPANVTAPILASAPAAKVDPGAGDSASLLNWYRLNFQLPAIKPDVWVPWLVRLDSTGSGFVYLNGHNIGRLWDQGEQRDFFLPECWLNFGDGKNNVITLCLCNDSTKSVGDASVRSAIVMPYTAYAEKR